MYYYTTWYTNEAGRSAIYDTTGDFIHSEMLKRECYRLHGNSHNKIEMVEGNERHNDSQHAEQVV